MFSINQIQPVLESHLMSPIGLLALAALIPLVIFYLMKKKPEEEVMPSMMFFMKDKKSGKVHKAFRKLQRNSLLLLHIFIIGLFALTLSQPFIESSEPSDKTVIVFDRSASMANQIDKAKGFVEDNTGPENTLIAVDSSTEVVMEDASERQVNSYLNDAEDTHLPGSLANGLELAASYEGDIVVASDLQHSTSSRSVEDQINALRNEGRTVKLFEPEPDNSWGIINVEAGRENSSIDVKNFMDLDAEVTATSGGTSRDIRIDAGAVETVTFSTEPGRNSITLGDDGFSPDNTAYISVPEEESYRVAFISDEENPYFEKALELIEFVELERYRPPVERELDADIYVFGETTRVLSETIREVEDNVERGASMIVFGGKNVPDLGFQSLPVGGFEDYRNETVEVLEPQTTSFKTSMLRANKTEGDSYSRPEEALVKSEYGNGNVFFYNVDDRDFRHRFIYPVFWKDVLQELTDQPGIEDLNLRTGQDIDHPTIETPGGNEESGLTTLSRTGFYETDHGIYAVNLVNEEESYSEKTDIETGQTAEETVEKNLQNLAALAVILFILVDLAYLKRIGEI